MPRSSSRPSSRPSSRSSSRSSSFKSSKSGYSSPTSPIKIKESSNTISPTVPVSQPQVVHHNHQVEKPGFFSNMWQVFGLGAGQSIAHNIFRSDPVVTHVNKSSSLEEALPKEFVQCMKENDNDKDMCNKYLEKKIE